MRARAPRHLEEPLLVTLSSGKGTSEVERVTLEKEIESRGMVRIKKNTEKKKKDKQQKKKIKGGGGMLKAMKRVFSQEKDQWGYLRQQKGKGNGLSKSK